MLVRILMISLVICVNAFGNDASASAPVRTIPWLDSPGQAFAAARDLDHPLLVYISSRNCGFCRKMERDTWSDSSIVNVVMRDFVPLKIDAERNADWLDRLAIQGVPAVIVLSKSGEILLRIEGYQPPEKVRRILDNAARSSGIRSTK